MYWKFHAAPSAQVAELLNKEVSNDRQQTVCSVRAI